MRDEDRLEVLELIDRYINNLDPQLEPNNLSNGSISRYNSIRKKLSLEDIPLRTTLDLLLAT